MPSSSDATAIRMPAEWTPHAACWLAWPWHPDWDIHLSAARAELVGLIRALRTPVAGLPAPEQLQLLVYDADQVRDVQKALGDLEGLRIHPMVYGDIWLRDTAPLFVRDSRGGLQAVCFRFNGWGEKYLYAGDDSLAQRIAEHTDTPIVPMPWVLEGGGIEVDGEGTLLTTRQCLLSESRNPGASTRDLEEALHMALGAERVVWLDRGLARDHTDGHIDTLARFVAPGVVTFMEPRQDDDPNRDVLGEIRDTLSRARDARGQKLELLALPSPGRILDSEGRVMPASYCNFYIGNATVVVPTYGSPYDDEAVARLSAAFPGRRVMGAPAKAILEGGGAFHCITQQQPA